MGIETMFLVGAGLSVATTAASTAMSVAGARADGQAAKNSAAYKAAVAANQATQSRANAAAATRDAEAAEVDASRVGSAAQRRVYQQDVEARQQIGEIVAEQGATGLRGSSQGAVRRSLRALAGRDRANLAEAGEAETADARSRVLALQQDAVNFENQAKGFDSDGQVALAEGRYAKGLSRMRAFSAGIGGAAQIGGTLLSAASNPIAQNFFARRGTGGVVGRPTMRPFAAPMRP